ANGNYRNGQNETGWGILEIETFNDFSEEIQSYAAGLIEGYCERLHNYIKNNLNWIKLKVNLLAKKDIYWHNTFTQLTGINDGYENNYYGEEEYYYIPNVSFKNSSVLLIQMSGDFFDLEHVFKKSENLEYEPSHCSGFIKITEGNKDLLMSHVSMSGYNTMNRILKLYKFAFDKKQSPGNIVSFSGYPAALSSADDYTLTSAGILSMETTIAVFNEPLYNKVKSKGQLHCWLRSYIANRLSVTARDWVRIFGRYNSGTYNNQWTVLDYKLFKPGQELPKNDLIWILEQIPGLVVSRDITWFINRYGYWPSYNIPFLSKISELSGFNEKGLLNNWWRWGYTPRAKIFHRDHNKVKDLKTLKELMRYNDYTHDEYSRCKCDPHIQLNISTRGDLNPKNGKYEVSGMGFRNHGSIDYKGTNFELFKQLRFEVIGGPTYGGPGNLPYFSWSNTKINTTHYGQPINWNFTEFTTIVIPQMGITFIVMIKQTEIQFFTHYVPLYNHSET
ncbi:Phospholipase B-like, partial [Meloidogyne graminicola]